MTDIIIIGAGASGLFAAVNLAKDIKVIILEKMPSPAKKLLLSGSGRCNITHQGNIRDLTMCYGDKNRFVSPCLNTFTNIDLLNYFKERGLKFYADKNGKYFPLTESSEDVLNILLSDLAHNKTVIEYNVNIQKIEKLDNCFQIITDNINYKSKKILLASGGKSYPITGSNGSAYKYAEMLGHSIIEPKPAMTPFKIENFELKSLSGVSIENCELSLFKNNKKIKSVSGDIVITHFGISGPAVLNISRYCDDNDEIKINFVNKHYDVIDKELIEIQKNHPKSILRNALKELQIPESLIGALLASADIEQNTKVADLSKSIRQTIAKMLTEYSIIIKQKCGFHIAMTTAGGINTNEINPKTMESKICPGLYFAGEMIDVDGDSGGYNLQFAFSSAYTASLNIIKNILII